MSLFLCTGNVRGNFQLFQKNRDETHAAITKIDTMTRKQENVVIVNAQDSGIVIFSTASNVACPCNDVEDLFIDRTFKCCPWRIFLYHFRDLILM
jgi:predicted P-loop ATPase/GTPase